MIVKKIKIIRYKLSMGGQRTYELKGSLMKYSPNISVQHPEKLGNNLSYKVCYIIAW